MFQVERKNAGKRVSEIENGGWRAWNSQSPGLRKVDEDKINTDGKIEIEENEYNKENNDDKQSSVNENADQTIDNPKTGLYIPMLLIILIGVSVIVIRKNIKNKVFKI